MKNDPKIEFQLPENPAVAIDNDDKTFMVIWSWGLRCNYDCSYCSPERHNSYSSHTTKENLLNAVTFLREYKNTMSQFIDHKTWYISITGGEPTSNPYFIETITELKNLAPEFKLDVTTNGAFNDRVRNSILENFDHITVSYHAEADKKLKEKVLKNIKYFYFNGLPINVNLMMHAYDYWDECVELADQFKEIGIPFVPRIIGESMEQNRFNHQYTEKQHQWMKDFWKVKGNTNVKLETKNVEKIDADAKTIREKNKEYKAETAGGLGKAVIGRYCCGKRDLCSLGNNTQTWNKSKLVNHTHFKSWYCLINFYFLYIDQGTGEVFHHQTCKTTWDPNNPFYRVPDPNRVDIRAPLGKISEYRQILDEFKDRTKNGSIPLIQCPRGNCGCGVCVPKAKEPDIADKLFKKHIKNLKPSWSNFDAE